METSQQLSDDDFHHDGVASAPKQPRIHCDETPASAAPPKEQTTEPDKDPCQNGLEKGKEDCKEEEEENEQSTLQQEEEEMEKVEFYEDEDVGDRFPTSLEGFKYKFNECKQQHYQILCL